MIENSIESEISMMEFENDEVCEEILLLKLSLCQMNRIERKQQNGRLTKLAQLKPLQCQLPLPSPAQT
jgi:hypothetical protein